MFYKYTILIVICDVIVFVGCPIYDLYKFMIGVLVIHSCMSYSS